MNDSKDEANKPWNLYGFAVGLMVAGVIVVAFLFLLNFLYSLNERVDDLNYSVQQMTWYCIQKGKGQ